MIKRSLGARLFRVLISPFMLDHSSEMVSVVKTVYAPDGKQRIRFLRTDGGIFGFQEEGFNDQLLDMVWQPLSKEPPEEFASLDAAIASAKAKVLWVPLVLH